MQKGMGKLKSEVKTRMIFKVPLIKPFYVVVSIFFFSPLFGEMIHFCIAHIFQMGWFNHQLEAGCETLISGVR